MIESGKMIMEDRMAVKHVLQLARDEREALTRIAKGGRGQ